MSKHPTPGTFIRPVGNFSYCLEVLAVIPDYQKSGDHMTCRRWGMNKQRQPFNDGRRDDNCLYHASIYPVGHDAWRLEDGHPRWDRQPTYYRQISVAPTTGQQELFT